MTLSANIEISRRPDYTLENMGRVFGVFRDFGIEMTEQEQHELDQLFCGFDYTDQLIDNNTILPGLVARHVLDFLTGKEETLNLEIPPHVSDNLVFLKEILISNKNSLELEKVVLELLSLHEHLIQTTDIREYVNLTKTEGIKHAEIAFLFLRRELTDNIRKFFILANVLGNLADNLLDLETDFAENKIAIKPTRELRFALRIELLQVVIALVRRYPKKRNLPKLAGKYVRYSLGI